MPTEPVYLMLQSDDETIIIVIAVQFPKFNFNWPQNISFGPNGDPAIEPVLVIPPYYQELWGNQFRENGIGFVASYAFTSFVVYRLATTTPHNDV